MFRKNYIAIVLLALIACVSQSDKNRCEEWTLFMNNGRIVVDTLLYPSNQIPKLDIHHNELNYNWNNITMSRIRIIPCFSNVSNIEQQRDSIPSKK